MTTEELWAVCRGAAYGGLLSIIGVSGGDWAFMRYNAVISSLQEENQRSLLASAERERIRLTFALCLKRKTANPVQSGALGFKHTHHCVSIPGRTLRLHNAVSSC